MLPGLFDEQEQTATWAGTITEPVEKSLAASNFP